MTVAAHTLGCKVNQCDTETLLTELRNMGFVVIPFEHKADVYIVNTCTVTHTGDKKSKQTVRRARKQNPSAYVAVCGCMAKNTPKPTYEAGADFVFDARDPDIFFSKMRGFVKKAASAPVGDVKREQKKRVSRTRAFIKIQDGCDRFCSYCIVPYMRGKPISRPMSDILSETRVLVQNGTREVVLTGIQAASYVDGKTRSPLGTLIKEVGQVNGLERLRLSSIDPWAVNDAFLSAVAETPSLCEHFHLSLQSGSDKILKSMNRQYGTGDFVKAAAKIRNLRPRAAITTDIIVGFPGENDADFSETISFVKEMKFAGIHVFEYSPRDGTKAANFPEQVSHAEKTRRGKEMRDAADELKSNFLREQIGTVQSVLFESEKSPGVFSGHGSNYSLVEVKSDENIINVIKNVQITDSTHSSLTGDINKKEN